MYLRASWATWSWVKMYCLTGRSIYPLDIDGAIAGGWPHSDSLKSFPVPQKDPSVGPVLYMGTLKPNGLAWDTFLKLHEWTKVMFKIVFYLMIPGWSGNNCNLIFLSFFYIRVRFGLMVWIWDDTGQQGALNRLFISLDPCSAQPYPTTSPCSSWRGPQHTSGFFSWTGLSSMSWLKSLNVAQNFGAQHFPNIQLK